jgi:anti-sigma B factor antagonist
MQLEAKKAQEILVVKVLDPRLDAKEAVDFKAKMVEYISSGHHTIILNLAEVRFIDSSGLGAIVSALKLLGRDGDLVLCGVTDPVMNVFKLTRMDRVFPMFPSESDALDALA